MQLYHKIDSVFKRDPDNNYKTFTSEYAQEAFAYLADLPWEATEKVDGTNIRISNSGIGGRTENAQIPTFLLDVLAEVEYNLGQSELPFETMLIGEGYGAKIQSGGHYIPDGQAFVLFDVLIGDNYQDRDNVNEIAEMLGIASVPVLGQGTLPTWVGDIARGVWQDSILHDGARNEGVVLRPATELRTRTGSRVITKLKYKDFD